MTIWKTPPDLEALQRLSAGTAVEHLGIEFAGFGDDWIAARMPVDQRTTQPAGLLHGGASVLLAETIGSIASHLCIDPASQLGVGLEINANHLRGVRAGWVTGTARAVHLGKSTHVWEIRITDDAGKLACISRLTVAVIARAGTAS